jgi:serine protease AprX
VAVVLHEAASSSHEDVLNEIQGFSSPEVLLATEGMLHLKVNQQDLERIAALDSVQAIEQVPGIVLHNDQIRNIIGVKAVDDVLQAARQTGLTGAGQVVAIADNGIDVNHEAFKYPNKIIARHSYRKEGIEDTSGHGTHVAGTLAGLAVKDWAGRDVAGVAPNAQLISLAMISGEVQSLPTVWYNDALKDAPSACRICNNSWGGNWLTFGLKQQPYGSANAEIIDGWALENPEFLIVRSAGNDGVFSSFSGAKAQVSTWATGKNVLTVGATYTDRPTRYDAKTNSDKLDYSLTNFQSKRGTVAPFSSRGPVLTTKRTKPDVVAPGVCILSARCGLTSTSVQDQMDAWLNNYGTFPGGGKSTDKLTVTSGTSMASPGVSGCAALLREAFAKWHNLSDPSAPLMKALLINGADDLGVSSNDQGFGQVNMTRTLKPLGRPPSGAAATSGSGYAQDIALPKDLNTITPFKTTVPNKSATNKKVNFVATLVYHDFKGEQINNHMNLIVTYKGTKRETYNSTNSAANNENVLRITVPDVVTGEEIGIGVQLKLLASGKSVPWGLAWDHFET